MPVPNCLKITADEINCLIFAYLRDSGMHPRRISPTAISHCCSTIGFTHSHFTLQAEAKLDHSPHFRKHIQRGQLVELLSKALLYIEVETHFETNSLTAGCRRDFSLLEDHVCSVDSSARLPTPPSSFNSLDQMIAVNGFEDNATQRTAATPEDDRRSKVVLDDDIVMADNIIPDNRKLQS